MKKIVRRLLIIFIIATIVALGFFYLKTTNIEVLNPKGPIAQQEANLIYLSLFLSLIILVPVFSLTFLFAIKYREGNKKAKYSPNLDGSKKAEIVWWGVPTLIIIVLATITWISSHQLDPYKAQASNIKPLTIEVISLNWKWLFIYPDKNIATVNLMEIPVNTPIRLILTSDAPMNSFWIPQLAGQIYTMPGMSTQLHLSATSTGDFRGLSANISGKGFSGMNFTARSVTNDQFDAWIESAKNSQKSLTMDEYQKLSAPSENAPISEYRLAQSNIFSQVVDKYMSGASSSPADNSMNSQNMSMSGMVGK